jgi:hypothetical protein
MPRLILCIAVLTVLCLIGVAFAQQPVTPVKPAPAKQVASAKPPTSEQTFKNIQALKGIPVDDFMGTMGVMSAALGFDCSDCHNMAGTEKVNWAADTTRKVISRKMVAMMTAINRDNFQGRQMVTCWSCHHGRDRPVTTPALEHVYGPPFDESDDVLKNEAGQTPAVEIIDRYLKAIGGAERLAAVKSYVASGSSVGFGGFGGGGKVEVFAKAPDQRAMWFTFPEVPDRGDAVRTYNGKTGWLRTPLTVLGEYELTGGELDGARFDALASFPAQLKTALTNLKVSLPATIRDLPGPSSQTSKEAAKDPSQEHLVNVVQGTGPRGLIVTLYFDQKTDLLIRMVRYGKSPIGRVPTQVDYSDYRDVDGIKMPFRVLYAWLDGRDAIQLTKIETNVPIDAAKFGRPPASTVPTPK